MTPATIAVHEELQLRARHSAACQLQRLVSRRRVCPGFSVDIVVAGTGDNCGCWLVQPPHACCGDRTIDRQALHHPAGLTIDCSVRLLQLLCDGWTVCLTSAGSGTPGGCADRCHLLSWSYGARSTLTCADAMLSRDRRDGRCGFSAGGVLFYREALVLLE